MDNKQLVTTILVALVVAVISSVVTVNIISKNVRLGPTLAKVNANECAADGVCEVNNITIINNDDIIHNIGWIKSNGNILISSQNGSSGILAHEVVLTDPDRQEATYPIFRINEGEDVILAPDTEVRIVSPYPHQRGGRLVIGQELIIENLSSGEIGYACLDNSGKIFRSQTPCV